MTIFTPREIDRIHKELNSLEIKILIIFSSHRTNIISTMKFIVYIDEDLAEIHIGEDD